MSDDMQRKNNNPSSLFVHQSAAGPHARSIPLRTALQIARERQRSRSSRRKIFREEPDRYLDIVRLMRETGEI
ncbi:MAG: hypothetical protein NQU46_01545 [Methanolinea sp.]|nr:hypothetical protein [Methanolinea sp.]